MRRPSSSRSPTNAAYRDWARSSGRCRTHGRTRHTGRHPRHVRRRHRQPDCTPAEEIFHHKPIGQKGLQRMPCDRSPTVRIPIRNTNIMFLTKEQVCPNLHASSYGPFRSRIFSGSSSISGHTPSPPISSSAVRRRGQIRSDPRGPTLPSAWSGKTPVRNPGRTGQRPSVSETDGEKGMAAIGDTLRARIDIPVAQFDNRRKSPRPDIPGQR